MRFHMHFSSATIGGGDEGVLQRKRVVGFLLTLAATTLASLVACTEITKGQGNDARFILQAIGGQSMPLLEALPRCPRVLEGTLTFEDWRISSSGRVTMRHTIEERNPGGVSVTTRTVERLGRYKHVGDSVAILDDNGAIVSMSLDQGTTLSTNMGNCFAGQEGVTPDITIALVYSAEVVRQHN